MARKPPASKDPLLHNLELEEERILKKIEDLKAELKSINKLKFRRKTQVLGEEFDSPVTNRNIDKLFYESVILEIIRNSQAGLRTSEIFEKIVKSGYDINYNTLRSYIVRLRDEKKIRKKPRGYEWFIP